MPSPARGRWHGEAVTNEVEALAFARRCPPHQSPCGDSFPYEGKPLAFVEVFQKADVQSKFATAVQHFLLLLQKKTLAKEKEPERISISPQTRLNRPEKPLRFFWTFPAIV